MDNNILLLYPPGLPYTTPPLGLAYLAAVIEKNGIPVKIVDASVEELSLKQTFPKIEESNCRILGITARTPDYPVVNKLLFVLKRRYPGGCRGIR